MNCFYCDTQMSDRMYVVAGYSVCGKCKKEKEYQEIKEMKKLVDEVLSKPIGADKYDDV